MSTNKSKVSLVKWNDFDLSKDTYRVTEFQVNHILEVEFGIGVSVLNLALGGVSPLALAAKAYKTDVKVEGNTKFTTDLITLNSDLKSSEIKASAELIGAGAFVSAERNHITNALNTDTGITLPRYSDLPAAEFLAELLETKDFTFKHSPKTWKKTLEKAGLKVDVQFGTEVKPDGFVVVAGGDFGASNVEVKGRYIEDINPVYTKWSESLGELKGGQVNLSNGQKQFTFVKNEGRVDGTPSQKTTIIYSGEHPVSFRQEKRYEQPNLYHHPDSTVAVDPLAAETVTIVETTVQEWDHKGRMVRVMSRSESLGEYDLNSNPLFDSYIETHEVMRHFDPDGTVTETLQTDLQNSGGAKSEKLIVRTLADGESQEYYKDEVSEDTRLTSDELSNYVDDVIVPRPLCFAAGTPINMSNGTQKPIEEIKIGDEVLAYDASDRNGLGSLSPRRVTRTYATPDKLVIDFHGLKVTPGHVFLCGDGEFAGEHRMLMEILRSDGTIVSADGTVLRAATNAPAGSREDAFLQVAYLTDANDALMQSGRMRAGTLIFTAEGETKSVLACLEAEGYRFDAETGLVAKDGEEPHPLYWYGEVPRPEDYVLKRSDLTDADLYAESGYRPEVATSAAPSRLGQGHTPSEGLLYAEAGKQAGETIH